jgi:holo-[acyl-carrier protein] synthase
MILGIGIDDVEVARLERLLDRRRTRALTRLFTDAERETCAGRARAAECLAARFACKEAFLKALGTGLRGGIRWTDVSVRSGVAGRPEIVTAGEARRRMLQRGASVAHVSFTHEGGRAVAVVVLEGESAPSTD